MRGFGYIPDRPGTTIDGHARPMLARASSTTPGCLSRMSAEVLDQGAAGSCVAHAMESAFFDRMLVQKTIGAKRGSRLQSYLNARLWGLAFEHSTTLQEVAHLLRSGGLVLPDEGCMPADAVTARFTLGVAAESFAPYSDAEVLASELPIAALQHAYDQRGKGKAYRCADTPEQREQDIRAAIDADFPCMIGLQVDKAFESYDGGLWHFKGASLGGHMLEIVAYDDVGVWVRNSWGDSWGTEPPGLATEWIGGLSPVGGFGHVAWDTAIGPEATDVYAMQWQPNYSEDLPR